jgi:hypothetical protein
MGLAGEIRAARAVNIFFDRDESLLYCTICIFDALLIFL